MLNSIYLYRNGKLKYKYFLLIIIIYLSICLNGSLLFYKYSQLFTAWITLISFAVMFFNRTKYHFQNNGLFLAFLLVYIILLRVLYGGIGIDSWLLWSSQILISVLAFNYDREAFFILYMKVVLVLALASIVGWIISIIEPQILTNLLRLYVDPSYGESYYGSILYVYRLRSDVRNVGIFTEPGRYQTVLVSAIYMLLFVDYYKINFSRRKYIIYLTILITTLVTTASTTGYIGMAGMLCCYILNERKNREKYVTKILYVLIVILTLGLVTNYYIAGDDSLIYSIVFRKVSDISETGSSGSARWVSVLAGIKFLSKYPIGGGIERFRAFLFSSAEYYGAAGAGLINYAASMGGIVLAITFIWLFRKMIRYNGFWVWAGAIFLYINTALAQTYMFYPALILMLMALCTNERCSRKTMELDDNE